MLNRAFHSAFIRTIFVRTVRCILYALAFLLLLIGTVAPKPSAASEEQGYLGWVDVDTLLAKPAPFPLANHEPLANAAELTNRPQLTATHSLL